MFKKRNSIKNRSRLISLIQAGEIKADYIQHGLTEDPMYLEKLYMALPFLCNENQQEAEKLFIEFILQFPLTKEGEEELFSYFWNHLFAFYELLPKNVFIRDVLQVLGDINEDGCSHEYQNIYFWGQVKAALMECKNEEQRYKDWVVAIRKQQLPEKLTKKNFERHYNFYHDGMSK